MSPALADGFFTTHTTWEVHVRFPSDDGEDRMHFDALVYIHKELSETSANKA